MDEFRPHLRDRLRRAFVKATEQAIVQRVKAPEQLTRLREIEERARVLTHRAERLCRKLYDVRVAREMRRIINDRAQVRKDLKFQQSRGDAFDQVSLRYAAERAARQRQEQLMARIRAEAQKQKRAVVDRPERPRARDGPVRLRREFDRVRERS